MNKRSLVAVAVAGLAGASGIVAYLSSPNPDEVLASREDPPPMEGSMDPTRVAPGEGESPLGGKNALGEGINKVATGIETPRSTGTASGDPADWDSGAVGRASAGEPAEALATSHRNRLEAALRREGIDVPWAETAQAELEAAYGTGQTGGVSFDEAECRSTMCRVTLTLDQPGKAGEIQLRRLMDRPSPWPAYRFLQLDRASGSAVVFVTREGYELPTLPSASGGARVEPHQDRPHGRLRR